MPPHVLVNGLPLANTSLCLSNWPAAPTPRAFAADTCAESVLRFLRSDERQQRLEGIQIATSARFDGGGLLALWALLHPDEAAEQEPLLVAAARAAEFGVATTLEALAFVIVVDSYESPNESPLAAELAALDEAQRTAALYRALLPQVGAMLADVKAFEMLWFAEYTDILQSNALLHSGAVQFEMIPELDLVVMDTPLGLHRLVKLTAAAGGSRLLTVRSENTYSLEYRYESWVQYRTYRPLARISLAPLAARLNMFERRDGRWRAGQNIERTPMLFFDDGRGRPSPSSIDRQTVVDEIKEFLSLHERDRALLWSPYERNL